MHAPPHPTCGHFDQDEWELYHVDVDRAESKNLAKEHPEKLQALIKAWFEEAEKNMCCRWTIAGRSRSLPRRTAEGRAGPRTVHLLSGYGRGPRKRRRKRSWPIL